VLKKVRIFPKPISQDRKRDAGHSEMFVFCEKSSGLAQFQATATPNVNNTIERMASLLAMQCLVRGSEPSDFAILVPAEKLLVDRLASRAKELLEEGRSVANPASLSPRQKEILHSVVCNRANKEIASKLNITVRTVKFHISTLLSKFGAENRAELARKASGLLRSAVGSDETLAPEGPLSGVSEEDRGPIAVRLRHDAVAKARHMRFSPRVMSA
jgi:DNA-binding CsgD family transcriptional regulator